MKEDDMMKYTTPYVELVCISEQDVLTFSYQAQGDAASDVLDFSQLVNR